MHKLLAYTSSIFCSSCTMKWHTTDLHYMRQHSRTCGWIEFHLLINLLDHPCQTCPRTWGPLIPFIPLFKRKCHRSSLYLYFQCCREAGMAAYFSDKLSKCLGFSSLVICCWQASSSLSNCQWKIIPRQQNNSEYGVQSNYIPFSGKLEM